MTVCWSVFFHSRSSAAYLIIRMSHIRKGLSQMVPGLCCDFRGLKPHFLYQDLCPTCPQIQKLRHSFMHWRPGLFKPFQWKLLWAWPYLFCCWKFGVIRDHSLKRWVLKWKEVEGHLKIMKDMRKNLCYIYGKNLGVLRKGEGFPYQRFSLSLRHFWNSFR